MVRITHLPLVMMLLSTPVFADIEQNDPDRLHNKCWQGVFLKALIWNGDNDWSVYLNNQSYTRLGLVGKLRIVKVTPDSVYFSLRNAKHAAPIKLSPLQSYDLIRHRVVAGDCRLSFE